MNQELHRRCSQKRKDWGALTLQATATSNSFDLYLQPSTTSRIQSSSKAGTCRYLRHLVCRRMQVTQQLGVLHRPLASALLLKPARRSSPVSVCCSIACRGVSMQPATACPGPSKNSLKRRRDSVLREAAPQNKKPATSSSSQQDSSGPGLWLIVGLGNPGATYERTRWVTCSVVKPVCQVIICLQHTSLPLSSTQRGAQAILACCGTLYAGTTLDSCS
jgi:hypothetical protein